MTQTDNQVKNALDRARYLLSAYREISPDYNGRNLSMAVVAGEMIADAQFVMSEIFGYSAGDVESVRILALNELQNRKNEGENR